MLALVIDVNFDAKPMPEAMCKALEMYRSTDGACFSHSYFEFN